MSKTTDDMPMPDFLFPLQKRSRSAKVTAQLTELGVLNRSAALRRAAEIDPDRRLERETLVALARGFLRVGNHADADTMVELLIRRVSGAVAGKVHGWTKLTPEDKTDAVQQMMTLLCQQVCDLSPSAEFWECNITSCLNRRLITLWHTLTDRQVPAVSSVIHFSDGETQDRLDQMPDPSETFADLELTSLVEMVSGGDLKKGKALFLRMSGYSEEEIAERLHVTSRTLRNWAVEARAAWTRQAKL